MITNLDDPLIGTLQIQPHRVRVDLEVMAMKRYLTFSTSPEHKPNYYAHDIMALRNRLKSRIKNMLKFLKKMI